MPDRPTPAAFRRAAQDHVCPWCGASTEGLEAELCPSCGNNVWAPLGPRDPGSPKFGKIGLMVALLLIAAVALIQQLGGSFMQKGAAPQAASIEPPAIEFEIIAKVYAKFQEAFKDPGNPEMSKVLGEGAVKALDDQAQTPEDKFRAALMAGEMIGTDDALQRLEKLEPKFAEGSPLVEDAKTMRALYAGEDTSSESREKLISNHGWIGKLAATHGKPDTDPERTLLLKGGMPLLIMSALIGLAVLMGLLAGIVLLIVAMVQGSGGRLRTHFVPPTPGGSIPIEMVVVFVIGFLVLKGISAAVDSAKGGATALWVALALQWGLCAVLLWPRFRGAKPGEGLARLGWHRGGGVLREIGCGFVGYIACLPIMACGLLVSVFLLTMWALIQKAMGHPTPPPPKNPILELAGGKSGILVLLMLYVLASVWAPIMEETVFRGALYRHLRSRWHWFPSAALTALCFGFMHGYQVLMLGPVIALGFGFSLLREWRGSLIAPMTAHCFHNATLLALLLLGMRLMGD